MRDVVAYVTLHFPRADRTIRRVLADRWRNAAPLLVLTLAFNLSLLADTVIAARLFGLAFLLLAPGVVLLAATGLRPRETSTRLAWAVGASILVLILCGLVSSYVLPAIGVVRPLSRAPMVAEVDVIVVAALLLQARRRDPLEYLMRGPTPTSREVRVFLGIIVVPVVAMAGAERLNNSHSGNVAIVALLAIGALLVGSFVVAQRAPRWMIRTAVFSATAAVLLMASMRSHYPYGFDIQKEFQVFEATLHKGVWHVPRNGNAYASMLSITIFPTVLTQVTHVSGTYLFKVLYPLVFSMFPVMVFDIAERWFSRRAALFGAVIVIVQGLYAADINGLARQEIALLYFGLFVVTAFDDYLSTRIRRAGVAITGIAMAITHYSTAYFAATVLVGGYVVYAMLRLANRRVSAYPVFSLPIVAAIVGVVLLWNVGITHSVQNVGNLVSTLNTSGLKILSGPRGTSLLQRFLNADVRPSVTAPHFAASAVAYYHAHAPWLHPYPETITRAYKIAAAPASAPPGTTPAIYGTSIANATTALAELLLLLTGVGILLLLWHERRIRHPERTELAAFALACIGLLGLLRLSGTISTLYNAPRGQVQGAPVLSVGLAFVLDALFARRRAIATSAVAATTVALALLLFSDSGLSERTLSGGGVDTLQNYGDAYQMFYYSDADMTSAHWLVKHHRRGDVIYADVYGSLQIYHFAPLPGIVTTLLPQVFEAGAYVYATSANIVEQTVRAQAGNVGGVYRFPGDFLSREKNTVFSTSTTRIYR